MPRHQFALIPSILVSAGNTAPIRLPDGSTSSDTTPLAAARYWHRQGAQRIEIVDQDATNGTGDNVGVINSAIQALRATIHFDLAGGIRNAESLARWQHHGSAQLVLDTATAVDIEFVRGTAANNKHNVVQELVIGGDDGSLHAPGTSAHGQIIWEWLSYLDDSGIAGYLVRDASHAKHWWQPHHDMLAELVSATRLPVTAGSGVDTLEDLHTLMNLVPSGLDGAVIGRALVAGYFTFAEAQTAVQARYDPYMWGPAQP